MKRILLIAILSILGSIALQSCKQECIKVPTKPFIITFKFPNSGLSGDSKYCRYEYYDKNSNKFEFFEKNEKYNIGDTIK